jgi:hypothetical protein
MTAEESDSRGEARQSFFAKQQLIDAARTVFQLLSAVLKNASLYPEAHPYLLTAADKLRSKVEELFVDRKEVALYLVGGELFFETLSVPIDQGLSLLLEQFASRDMGGIVFKPGLASQELNSLRRFDEQGSRVLYRPEEHSRGDRGCRGHAY